MLVADSFGSVRGRGILQVITVYRKLAVIEYYGTLVNVGGKNEPAIFYNEDLYSGK